MEIVRFTAEYYSDNLDVINVERSITTNFHDDYTPTIKKEDGLATVEKV